MEISFDDFTKIDIRVGTICLKGNNRKLFRL